MMAVMCTRGCTGRAALPYHMGPLCNPLPYTHNTKTTVNRSVLQRGRELLAGGYCLYAGTTLFVLALKGKGTHVFALDPAVGDFVLQRANVQVPARGA